MLSYNDLMSHDPRRIDKSDLVICRTQKGHWGWLEPHKGPHHPHPPPPDPGSGIQGLICIGGDWGLGFNQSGPAGHQSVGRTLWGTVHNFLLGDVREHGSLCCRGDLGAFIWTISGAASQLKMSRFLAALTWPPSCSSIVKYSGCQEGPLGTFDRSTRRAQGGQNRLFCVQKVKSKWRQENFSIS